MGAEEFHSKQEHEVTPENGADLSPEQLEGFRERIRMAAQGMAATHFDGPVELPGFGGTDAPIALRRVRAVSSD